MHHIFPCSILIIGTPLPRSAEIESASVEHLILALISHYIAVWVYWRDALLRNSSQDFVRIIRNCVNNDGIFYRNFRDITRPRAFYAHRRQLQRAGVPPPANDRGDKNTTSQKFSGESPSPAPTSSLPDQKSFSPSRSPLLHPIAPIHSPSISSVSALSPSEPPRGISLPPYPALVELHTPPFAEPEPGRIPAPSPLSVTKGNFKGSPQTHRALLLSVGVIGGTFLVLFSATSFVLCRRSKVIMVKPWATGLSGQLQKAFVTGKKTTSSLIFDKYSSESRCWFVFIF